MTEEQYQDTFRKFVKSFSNLTINNFMTKFEILCEFIRFCEKNEIFANLNEMFDFAKKFEIENNS